MIVKGHEGHVISVSTVFKVHYNQKLGDPLGHFFLGGRTVAFGGIDAPAFKVYFELCVTNTDEFYSAHFYRVKPD